MLQFKVTSVYLWPVGFSNLWETRVSGLAVLWSSQPEDLQLKRSLSPAGGNRPWLIMNKLTDMLTRLCLQQPWASTCCLENEECSGCRDLSLKIYSVVKYGMQWISIAPLWQWADLSSNFFSPHCFKGQKYVTKQPVPLNILWQRNLTKLCSAHLHRQIGLNALHRSSKPLIQKWHMFFRCRQKVLRTLPLRREICYNVFT